MTFCGLGRKRLINFFRIILYTLISYSNGRHTLVTMDSKLFSFITASFTSLFWTSLPSIVVTLLLLICACMLVRKYQNLSCFLFGIIWMASVGHWQYSLQLSSVQSSQPVQIIGEINSLVIADKNIRFNIKVTQINDKHIFFDKIFLLISFTTLE